jgi:hypothetical protein
MPERRSLFLQMLPVAGIVLVALGLLAIFVGVFSALLLRDGLVPGMVASTGLTAVRRGLEAFSPFGLPGVVMLLVGIGVLRHDNGT